MSRLPPGLLYLTIYNTSLQPIAPPTEDDEDADEQAQILFYTARERAVSRDRILRQVGLAKALVNFSSMFGGDAVCENVHSQTRRMVMLSPEPDFWIHACVEVAKTPRQVTGKGKSKNKAKEKEKVKPQDVVYDYHDGSVRDIALRAHILQGYEEFKLTHGSFTSILSKLGQQALELQLERFFTVWAWRWDTSEQIDFTDHLGAPTHPSHRVLTPLLDELSSNIPSDTTTFALIPPYVIPSTKLLHSKYPNALARYIATRIPPPPPPPPPEPEKPSAEQPSSSKPEPQIHEKSSTEEHTQAPKPERPKSISFLNLPPMNLNMDVRNIKWNWGGYMSFGKGGGGSTSNATPKIAISLPQTPTTVTDNKSPLASDVNSLGVPADLEPPKSHSEPSATGTVTPDIDTESLQEAISTENALVPTSPSRTHSIHSRSPSVTSPIQESNILPIATESPIEEKEEETEPKKTGSVQNEVEEEPQPTPIPGPEVATTESIPPSTPSAPPAELEPDIPETPVIPPPTFLSSTVYLLPESDEAPEDPCAVVRKRVWHATIDNITFACVVDADTEIDLKPISQLLPSLIHRMQEAIKEDEAKALENSIPTVTKILEPQDLYIISKGPYTTSSKDVHGGGFKSKSEHLFYGQQILESDMDVLEVFSRGQNPQHWHISRRGLGTDKEGNQVDGEAFMEIARKESTLTDVDNVLAGVTRKFVEEMVV
ncbi:hypothetical protein C8Q75DRAFT_767861 [Abortiporus biennis]|nr:hypothetical protein C8Q75DRAFT_767861 [Abortiporus biennis]